MRNLVRLPTIQNVAAGQHCVLSCPIGPTYDFIQFKVTNVTAADLKNFKIMAGGRTVSNVSSFQIIEDLNTFYERDTQSGWLTLWFYRPEEQEEQRAFTSFGTVGIQSLTIEWDLDGGVTSPAIEAWAMTREPQPTNAITKIREYPVTFATSGFQQIDNIPRGPAIRAIHLKKADVSQVEFEINTGAGPFKLIEGPKALLETAQKQHDRTPVTASYTHLDFNLTGRPSGYLLTKSLVDMRVKPTIDTSGALTAVVEYIDVLGGL